MRLETHFQQRMDLRQTLAPRMIQSMEILQMPIMELQEKLQQELLENPVLELSELVDNPQPDEDGESPDDSLDVDPGDKELVIDDNNNNEEDFDRLDALSRDWEDAFNEEPSRSRASLIEESDKKLEAMQNMPTRPQSVQDYLTDQVSFLDLEEEQARRVLYLISYIDPNGFLSVLDETDPKCQAYLARSEDDYRKTDTKDLPRRTPSMEELLEGYTEDETTMEEMEDALRIVQHLEPRGIGARDLKECLLLQLQPDTPHVEVVRALISDHLEDIQENRLPMIQKRTGFDLDAIQEGIEELRHLNPRPGSEFQDSPLPYVEPDIVIEKNDEDGYDIRLTDDWLPSITLNQRYIDMYRQRGGDPKMREFLKQRIQSAHWLQDSIQQRRNTLEKVTRAIIKYQKEFLDKGPEHIEPLKMQQIANEVGVHVTTVSRAVDDKWVQTPRGIFPLKRFFGGGKELESGEEVAYEIIKQKLSEIVANEDKTDPLSDEALMAALDKAGYPIARRTITKYRKVLNIPSSRQRKVWTNGK